MNKENRRSVRTYDGNLIMDADREKLQQLIAAATNPYGIPIEYRFLAPDQYGLKSPVLSGETLYLAGKVKRVPHFEEAFGYSLESIVLGAWDLGIGTVWIGGTMNREKFEEAMELQQDEVMAHVKNAYPRTILFLHADEDDTPKEIYEKMGFETVDKLYEYLCTDLESMCGKS